MAAQKKITNYQILKNFLLKQVFKILKREKHSHEDVARE
jgi:hypothetical protein